MDAVEHAADLLKSVWSAFGMILGTGLLLCYVLMATAALSSLVRDTRATAVFVACLGVPSAAWVWYGTSCIGMDLGDAMIGVAASVGGAMTTRRMFGGAFFGCLTFAMLMSLLTWLISDLSVPRHQTPVPGSVGRAENTAPKEFVVDACLPLPSYCDIVVPCVREATTCR